MESLSELIQSERHKVERRKQHWLSELTDEDRADLHEAITDNAIQTMSIWRALKKRGVKVSYSTIERYRKERHGE